MKNFYVIIGIVAVGGSPLLASPCEAVARPRANRSTWATLPTKTWWHWRRNGLAGTRTRPLPSWSSATTSATRATFALQIKPQVDLAYIQTGQAKFVYYDYPNPDFPFLSWAARAARCAGDQERYFEYHDAVYSTFDDWWQLQSGYGHFNDLADEVGLDTEAFESCLDSDSTPMWSRRTLRSGRCWACRERRASSFIAKAKAGRVASVASSSSTFRQAMEAGQAN